ncbi:MAG: glycosyltransferase [Pyrinomonadaceae bacterium]
MTKLPEMNRPVGRSVIMIFSEFYLPGYKSGGGMRTIVNMVERLSDQFDFRILTKDHDGNLDVAPYSTVGLDRWNSTDNAKVYYISRDRIRLRDIRKIILDVRPAAIYTNSFFSNITVRVLQLRKLKLIPAIPLILAPCGELSQAALNRSYRKKRLFLSVSKSANLYKGLIWKASSPTEKVDIERIKPASGRVMVIPDLLPRKLFEEYDQAAKPQKIPGEARMVFFSRFVRIKNFKCLLEILLTGVQGKLSIDVVGPIEDEEYWLECKRIIDRLSENITVRLNGPVPNDMAVKTMFGYHFFLLTSESENFGHALFEALAAGCPLLISDRTPMDGLEEKGIGWDLPLEAPERWIEAVQSCIDMTAVEYDQMSTAARGYVEELLSDKEVEERTAALLSGTVHAGGDDYGR